MIFTVYVSDASK